MKLKDIFQRKIEIKKVKKDEWLVIQLDGEQEEVNTFCKLFKNAIKNNQGVIVNKRCKLYLVKKKNISLKKKKK